MAAALALVVLKSLLSPLVVTVQGCLVAVRTHCCFCRGFRAAFCLCGCSFLFQSVIALRLLVCVVFDSFVLGLLTVESLTL